jgi:hypothetical protein
VPRLRRSDNVGESMPQPCRAGLTFGGRPYGPQSPDRFLETHFQDEPAEPQIPRLRSGLSSSKTSFTKCNGTSFTFLWPAVWHSNGGFRWFCRGCWLSAAAVGAVGKWEPFFGFHFSIACWSKVSRCPVVSSDRRSLIAACRGPIRALGWRSNRPGGVARWARCAHILQPRLG